jgi:dienelactone hydrolase
VLRLADGQAYFAQTGRRRQALEQQAQLLERVGLRYEADHAFCNERRAEVYDANAANQAWERMLAFLGKNLG